MERIFGKIKRLTRKLDGKCITAKFMSAVLIASTVLNAAVPAMAYAAEPELATVSLAETEHGKLSFGDGDDISMAVEVGTDVTVKVTPDEGYFADSLTVFTGDEDGVAVDVKDGEATFTVEGDTIVTSTFYQNGTVGSAALKPVDVDEGKSVASVEDYVRDHADPQYVGKGDDLTRADVLTVTTTVVDGNVLPDGTLDALWADNDGDGMSDNWSAMLSQAVSHAVLFEVDPDSDYYVGWAGADISGAKLTDWGASDNNADARMRDGFIMDDATGLVYVPKSYTELNDEGKPMVASSRIQLVYTTSDPAAEATFDFNSTATDVRGDVASKGKTSVPVTAATTKVTLATDDEALDSVSGRTIDSVTVNGIEYTPDMGMWEYDAETGSLEFAMAPAGIHAMSVKMSNNFGKDVANFFALPAPRMSVNTIGTWEFKTAPTVGQTFRTQGKNQYTSNYSGRVLPAVENTSGGNFENKTINQAMGWQPVDLSKLQAGRYSIERTADIWVQDTGTVKIPTEARLALTCGHVGVDNNFNFNPGYNEPAATEDTLGQHIRIFSVSGGEAIIGVTVPTSHTQAGAGFFKINWRVIAGKLNLHKSSANPSITDGNDCYSLEGAEFTVYNAANQSMGVLRTNANGDTNTLELPEGTYTVRETKAPAGYLPAADQTVTVRGGQTTTVQVSDPPASDPMAMLVGKYDGDKEYIGNGNLPSGSASLKGAEFTVEYYDTLTYDNYDALEQSGVEPTRSWVFKTDKDGFSYFDEEHLVSGDDFYRRPDQKPTLPRGTVVIYESKAPVGYKLNSNVSFQKIQENPLEGVTTFNLPEIPEPVIRGGVSVQKLDSETGKTPQGSASLEGISFSIINDNENIVKVDGKTYAKGETVKVITTDAKGFATTGADTLPYGDYIIRETKTNGSYLNTSTEMRVQVREDGKVYSFSAEDDVERGGVRLVKTDSETGSDPQNGLSFDGTQFELKSLNDNPIIVDGKTYAKNQVIDILVIKDGQAVTDPHMLPYGTYSVQEVKAPEGYLLDDTVHEFRIVDDGVLVNPIDHDGSIENQIMRSDLEFTKKGEDGQDRLAGVAFKLTSEATGENHVVVTDENGYFSSASSWNKHTHDTNGNDWALKADGVIDSSKLDATAGVWFGDAEADDSKGALPYGTYAIEELRCTANEGYQLIETTVIVSRDGKVYDFGTLTDVKAAITTKAYDPMDGDSLVGMGEVKVSDKVTYANLFPNRDYKLTAELHDSATGDVLLDASGHPITVEKRFTAQNPTGFEVVEFTIDTIALGGKTITVYEKLYDDGGSLIAEHTDKSDVNQQVTVIEPEIGTTAVDGADGDKNVATDDKATVTDRVAYKNLVPGKEYTVKGTLHIKKTDDEGKVTEEILKVDGKPVTAETTFTPESAEGTVDVTFTFDSLSLKDKTHLVAFESLEHDGHELASHADIEDERQTVTVRNPRITTSALDGHDSDKNVVTDAETTVIDTVKYSGLIPGKEYTMKGSMQVKKTDKDGKVTAEPLEVDGKPVTAETTFTPDTADGKVDVTFTFDSSAVEDKTDLVVFESLERGGVSIAEHKDIEDEKQTTTTRVTGISTTATDELDGDKTVIADAETTITDDVAYENALTGVDYTMAGILMDADTGLPILTGDGSEKYTENDVAKFMQKLLDVLGIASTNEGGKDYLDVPVSQNTADGVTKSQSVRVHVDGTYEVVTSENGMDGDGLGYANVDTSGSIGYDKLTDEQKAAISNVAVLPEAGIILDYTGADNLPADIDTDALDQLIADNSDLISHLVFQKAEFTPDKYDGTVPMDFHFNANDVIDRLGGETKDIVVFEVMFKNGSEGAAPIIVASECDLDCDEQTVNLIPSVISTTATDKSDGDHTLMAGKDAVITDRVAYEGLIPGKEYTLKATLMDKETGEMLSINDQHVTAELKFTPNSQSGTVDIDLGKFDASSLDGHDLVVFEELYKQTTDGDEATDVLVAEHKDIEDEAQTVTVTTTPPGGFFGKTGGNAYFVVLAIAALVVLAGGCAYYGIKNRRAAKSEDSADGKETGNGDASDKPEA